MTTYKSVAFTTAVLVLGGAAAVAQAPLVTDTPPPEGAMEHAPMQSGCPMMQHGAMGSMPHMMMGQGMMGLTDGELTAQQRQQLRELMAAEELDVRAIGNAYDQVAKLQKDVLMLELRAQEEVQNIMRDGRAQAP